MKSAYKLHKLVQSHTYSNSQKCNLHLIFVNRQPYWPLEIMILTSISPNTPRQSHTTFTSLHHFQSSMSVRLLAIRFLFLGVRFSVNGQKIRIWTPLPKVKLFIPGWEQFVKFLSHKQYAGKQIQSADYDIQNFSPFPAMTVNHIALIWPPSNRSCCPNNYLIYKLPWSLSSPAAKWWIYGERPGEW